MSQSDLELRLTHWLADGPHSAPADVVEAGLNLARHERQLRVVTLPWPRRPRLAYPDYRSLAQAAATVAAIALVVIIGIWGFNNAVIPPAATPSPPTQPSGTPGPSASPRPSPTNTAAPSPTAIGGGWSVPQLIGAGEFDDVAMAVDPARGTVHIAGAISIGAGDSRGIVYMTNASGQWTTEQVAVAPRAQDNLEYYGEPDIAVDTGGAIWIAFTRYDCGGCTPTISSGILVTHKSSGSWSLPEQVAGPQSYGPSLAVRDGIGHVAYAFGQMPEQPSYPSYYATSALGGWVSTQLAPNATLPQLVLDEGVPVVAYRQPNGVTLTWLLSDAQTNTTVAGPDSSVEALFLSLDPVGQLHVVWDDGAGVLHDVTVGDGPSTTAPELTLNRLRVDGVVSVDSGLLLSGRGLDEANVGPWSLASTGITTRFVAGETTMTDIGYAGGRNNFVYSYADDQADHGIWYSISLSSE